jgi:hypothetical protein
MALMWPSYLTRDVVGPFVILVVLIVIVFLVYVRGGRNAALENLIAMTEFRSPKIFCGTLAVENYKPGKSLRLCTSTAASNRLQFWYRWVIGNGPQAIFDEVIFDGSLGSVELKKKNTQTTALFSEYSAIRMRETAPGRDGCTAWHIELVPLRGRVFPFATSERGDRKTTFEQAASVAKAVSAIMAIPVQVSVAGNIWTPGWPPRTYSPK